ncbi:MAG: hypothetical protein JSW43_04000 [Gemmatimonadota bacterium]|nr:MAG: hypothetical protein JSW43_04000 [Gemmatimonadota bacterium]
MKRAVMLGIATVGCLALIGPPAQAQTSKFAGISGGATYGDLSGGVTNTRSRWGGMGGVFVGYRNWYTIGVLEANWVQKGGDSTRIDYIEVPFLIGGGTTTDAGILFRLYTGIGIGFPISCNSTSGSTLQNCDQKKSPEWTWPIGLLFGRQFGNGPTFGALDARYSIGLSDAFNNSQASNRSWQFRLMIGRMF